MQSWAEIARRASERESEPHKLALQKGYGYEFLSLGDTSRALRACVYLAEAYQQPAGPGDRRERFGGCLVVVVTVIHASRGSFL